jgi:hypothetical protein
MEDAGTVAKPDRIVRIIGRPDVPTDTPRRRATPMDVDLIIRVRVIDTGESRPADAVDEAQQFMSGFLDSADSVGDYEFVLAAPVLAEQDNLVTPGTDDETFDYQPLDADNVADAQRSLDAGDLYGIIDITGGGIVAYAIGQDHADAIVRALRAASGEYEAEMVSAAARV